MEDDDDDDDDNGNESDHDDERDDDHNTHHQQTLDKDGRTGRNNDQSPDTSEAKQSNDSSMELKARSQQSSTKRSQKKKGNWSRATVKPSGTATSIDDTCLTCIERGVDCRGTALVEVDGKRGDDHSELRCERCAGQNDTRKRHCYWLEPEKQIFTYPEAQHYYHPKDKPHGNSKAGRQSRADEKARILLSAELAEREGDDHDVASGFDGQIETRWSPEFLEEGLRENQE